MFYLVDINILAQNYLCVSPAIESAKVFAVPDFLLQVRRGKFVVK